jgi:hypothetical protein
MIKYEHLYIQNAQKTYTTAKRQATRMAQQELNLSHGKT